MALNLTASKIVAPVAAKAPKAAAPAVAPVAKRPRAVTNGNSARQMLTWTPQNNKFFETLSYLPPLTEEEIALQVRYIVGSGWTPCLEFSDSQHAYVSDDFTVRMSTVCNYFDNRYWTMWKLPMFGCTDPSQVQHEIDQCVRTFPDSFIRIVGFDSVRQVQSAGFLVHRPPHINDYCAPDQRSVGGAYGSQGGYGGGYSSPPPMNDGYGQGPQSGGYRRSAY